MSGILGIGGGGDTEFYPYTLDQSVRFNDDDTAMLSRTFASAGNRRTWTWSGWVKRGNLGDTRPFFVAGSSGSAIFQAVLMTYNSVADRIQIYNYDGSYNLRFATTQVFRDVSGWYHIVLKMDTTQATSTDRFKLYINGEAVTAFEISTYPSQNFDTYVNTAASHRIGRNFDTAVSTKSLDGYLAEVNFIDGTALDASSFGETKAGIWIPKDYTGSYGTNGFYLNFKDDIVSEGFNTVTYQGKGTTQSISGLGFSPDFVWIKNRTSTAGVHHALFDSVRGSSGGYFYKLLSSFNGSQTYYSQGAYGSLTSIDGDGFTVSSSNSDYQQTNASGDNYVAWAWDAGTGSAASNTDGDITSTVKANTAYGFSVVQFESDGVNEVESVGHGLGTAPSFIITKNIDATTNWPCYHASLGNNYRIDLNGSGTSTDNGQQTFGSATDTFSVWKSNLFGSGTCIAYCFAEISGYSKFGSYTGTGASGNKITTGFEPAFVMVKSYDQTRNWIIWDNTRTPTNPADGHLHPNGTVDEQTGSDEIQFDSDGFTFLSGDDDSNANTYNYIYMAFADTRDYAFWKDQSGNGNHFTPENLEYTDTLKDTPTSNFPTMNKLWQSKGTWTTAEGNLQNTWAANNYQSAIATMGLPATGKWYWEIYLKSRTYTNWLYWNLSISDYAEGSGNNGNSPAQWSTHHFTISAERSDGSYIQVSSGSKNSIASSGIYDTGDVIQVAFDADNKRLYLGDSGTWFLSADPGAESGDGTAVWYNWSDDAQGKLFPALNVNYFTYVDVHNFGQDSTFAGNLTAGGNADANGIGDFKYTVPSGYLALCAANLPDPGINPNAGQTPEDYFNTVLYTGDGTSSNAITGVGFQPDWTWLKGRSVAYTHGLYDSVRGATEKLSSNLTNAEATSANGLTAFNSDGFTLGSDAGTNQSSATYVAWNWKAGGTAVSNTDGSITSSVSASPESGFSIVTYTGTGATSSGVTIGHGLGATPEMIIGKRRDSTDNWSTWHKDLGGNYGIWLDLTNARNSAMWDGYTNFSSTVFSPPDLTYGNVSGATYVNYLFTSIDGYSKVGSYTGNGSTDGSFVFTGFRPAWVMVKRTDSTGNWTVYDNERLGYNVDNEQLYPNLSNAEGTSTHLDLLSNGFKWRTSDASRNASGGTYIYLAFAENPFKYANAR